MKKLLHYVEGNSLDITLTFRYRGSLVDPTNIFVSFIRPTKNELFFSYNAEEAQDVTRLGKGRYALTPLLDDPGVWRMVVTADAPVQGASQWEFSVEALAT